MDLNHLLGRKSVEVELDSVRHFVAGKVVLVTGAAGSIGSELCRKILACGPAKLVCVDHNETGLFYLQMEFRERQTPTPIVYCVEDFSHSDSMKCVFSAHQVQIVFHAAGYKHVPLMEENPRAALENNVFGLIRLVELCETAHCESLVLISSDKAVNPTSVMGCTKRLGELILASRPNGGIRCISVRFGNVLGSQGSVVPVLYEQIVNNLPLTVTHREATRLFIPVDEAVSLLLLAAGAGKRGEILSLGMGESVRILDLAGALIRSCGKDEKDVEIKFTGLRPGEKLHEELFYRNEQVLSTSCDRIKRAFGPIPSWADLKSKLDALRLVLYKIDENELRSRIQGIIPEYRFEMLRKVTSTSGKQASEKARQNTNSRAALSENFVRELPGIGAEITTTSSS